MEVRSSSPSGRAIEHLIELADGERLAEVAARLGAPLDHPKDDLREVALLVALEA